MKRTRSIETLLFLLVCSAAIAFGLPHTAHAANVEAPASFDIPAIDRFLEASVQTKGRVGFSVVIVKDGQPVLTKGYGFRSAEKKLPVETNTMFAIGSVTKQFTCACIFLLAEEGKLSVYDKVAAYYPDLTRARDITLLDLMNHTSGYHDYYPLDFVDRRMLKAAGPDEVIQRYAGAPLDFEPGTKYSYSNTGYLLLGRIVEKVSGQPLGIFLQNQIFKPLGMTRSSYEPDLGDPRLAQGYTAFALSPPGAVAPEAKGWLGAAGGIYSTPSDLARWDLALIGGKILKTDSYNTMTTSRMLADGSMTEYGCGLGVRLQQKRQVLVHTGAVAGFSTWNSMIPSTRSALIITANADEALGDVPGQIFDLMLKTPPKAPQVQGLSTEAAVKAFFAELQKNKIERSKLAEEFNWFLTPEKAAGTAQRLKRFGTPTEAEVLQIRERGGLEVSVTRLKFKSGALKVLMYRRPDGIIEQYFVNED